MARPSPHTPQTRAVVEAALRQGRLPVRRIARENGLPESTVRGWCRRLRLSARKSERRRPPSVAALDARLRSLVARQIAAFDARLAADDGVLDSARVLRDLAGLRRLIDDLGKAPEKRGGDPDADPAQDLGRRRARLAEQLAAFTAGELAERLSRDAAAGRHRDAGA